MQKTNWNYPTTMWVGQDRIKDLSIACKNLNINKPLLVTDKGLAGSDIIQNSLSNLKQNSKITKTIITAFVLIFVIYFFSNLLDALGSSSQVSPLISQITTPVIVLIFSFIFLSYSYLRNKKMIK